MVVISMEALTPEGSYDDEVAHLDPGCEGGFRHVQTGTQWWFNSILVKEEVCGDVGIDNYGWEWFESGTSVAHGRPVNRPAAAADLFIQFSVTTSQEVQATNG